MKLTWEEIKFIANELDEVISENFHNAMLNVVSERGRNTGNVLVYQDKRLTDES